MGGEPIDISKTYRVAYGFFFSETEETEETEPLLSTMEEAAAAMGEYLRSGQAVLLPDVPVPDQRIIPLDEAPADAVAYRVVAEEKGMP